MSICSAKSQRHVIDFQTTDETELHRIEIPLEFHMLTSGTVHGLAFWFDVAFIGIDTTVWLSTSPTQPLTHWYQVRCMLSKPIFAKQGQLMTGRVLMVANAKQSYDLTIECKIEGTSTMSTNTLDLKNPYFRYTGVQPAPPPGNLTSSPSEDYWQQVDLQGASQAVNLVNGVIVDGLGHVSLDSGPGARGGISGGIMSSQQPNIHQGSIPATGRRDKSGQNAGSSSVGPSSQTSVIPPSSSATSLPFNQLIGGGISPSLVNTAGGASTGTSRQPNSAAAATNSSQQHYADYAMLENIRNIASPPS